jgi:hypothetical protein
VPVFPAGSFGRDGDTAIDLGGKKGGGASGFLVENAWRFRV